MVGFSDAQVTRRRNSVCGLLSFETWLRGPVNEMLSRYTSPYPSSSNPGRRSPGMPVTSDGTQGVVPTALAIIWSAETPVKNRVLRRCSNIKNVPVARAWIPSPPLPKAAGVLPAPAMTLSLVLQGVNAAAVGVNAMLVEIPAAPDGIQLPFL